eukprot:scaffold23399_cov54-Cyclotella_meneghiniana.AAC.1
MALKKGARCKIAKKSREKAQRNSEYLSRPTSTPRCKARGEGHSSSPSQGLPVVIQSPVAKSPHFAPAHGGPARQASGNMWYDWQALASQSPHSPGDCLMTVKI